MATTKLTRTQSLLGVAAILILIMLPLVLVHNTDFGGSDGAGSEAIEAIAPEYDTSWATNWWEPPGGETESMLFALQATVGGIFIGYAFGFFRGRKRGLAQTELPPEQPNSN